ncbi:phenylalanine--tRNA ligase subunit beta [Candidatus Saccharibacteria bacterium]|nr:phenylalanine--tRNA ligase subunit beta [Candidatus Saccharibacteria bacterium]
MKISLNEIKKLVPEAAQVSTDELAALIGSRLVEVEEKIDLSQKYSGIYIVKVVECEDIPDTHLHLCQIDNGEKKIQVVCGAPNVHKDMLAVWIAPGAIVPQTYGGENFEISMRPLRGYDSYGMLAAVDELDLGTDHEGIAEIDPNLHYLDADGAEKQVVPGASFATVFDLNDVILDIENKSLTHRPDTFGLIGFAREVAGILGIKFAEPEVLMSGGEKLKRIADEFPGPKIEIKLSETCPRYSCVVMDIKDPTATEPYLTADAIFLAKAGMRSINKIVDATNIMMLMTGQPLHAFDYDKFLAVGGGKEPKIIIRTAHTDEQLQLLDGKTIKCDNNDILITSNDVPVALAGAMGCANTEIDQNTKRVILESATFSLYHLRKTQMKHGIFSEAITRFTKGQPAGLTLPVLEATANLLGGNVSAVADCYPAPEPPSVVKITTFDINSLLGTEYDQETITKTLENVGFTVVTDGSTTDDVTLQKFATLVITAPYWRTDIHIKEDITEEIGRLLGFDNIEKTLPLRPFIATKPNAMFALKTKLRNFLSDNLAAHEVLTYSFVSRKLQEIVGEDPEQSYQIVNSISPELQCFRQSIVPSLLEKTYENTKAGCHDFTIYEMNQVTDKGKGLTDEQVPDMFHHLAVVTTGDYYQAKADLLATIKSLHLTATLQPAKTIPSYYEPLRSAEVYVQNEFNKPVRVGTVGEIRGAVRSKLKLPEKVAAFELDLGVLLVAPETARANVTISRFPYVERDLTIKLPKEHQFIDASSIINEGLMGAGNMVYSIEPTSVYQAKENQDTTNYSFHLKFASLEKTLKNAEISAIMDSIEKNLKTLGAEVV